MEEGEVTENMDIIHCQEELCNNSPYAGAALIMRASVSLAALNLLLVMFV